jgi:RNA polymerase sigma factor (sigma-70 family)
MDQHRGEPELADGPSLPATADSELLRRFVAMRDEQAFGELVRRHSSLVLGVCRRTLHDGHDAEEAFQAAFFVLAKKAAHVRISGSLAPWLYGVAYRVAIRAAAQRARRRAAELPDNIMTIDEALEQVAECHWRRVLDDELNELPEKYRGSLVLHYLLGKTNQEVAAELGLSVRTVEGRQRRGKELLKRRLLLRKVSLPMALGAVTAMQAASAHAAGPLIAATIEASLSFAHGTSAACSAHAVRLAQSEVLAMTSSVAPVSATMVTLLAIGAAAVLAGGQAPVSGHGGALPLSIAALAVADESGGASDADPFVEPAAVAVEAKSAARTAIEAKPKELTLPARNAPGGGVDLYQRSAGEMKIVSALETGLKAPLEFIDTPMTQVAMILSETYGVPILFDNVALELEGISPDVAVNITVREIPLRSALRLMLNKISSELAYIVRDDVLLITSREVAESNLETHVYDMREALEFLDVKLPDIVDRIPSAIVPDSWRDNGTGDGTIETLGDFYVAVNQTQEVHEEFARFLAQIVRDETLKIGAPKQQ